VFYLLVTAMFVAGVHRAGARVALGFGVGAAMMGVALPSALLVSRWPDGTVLVTVLLLAGGLAAMFTGRRPVRRAGAALVAALALALLFLNSRIGAIESLCILATMFAGTAIRGVQDGRLRARPAAAMIAVVAVLTMTAGLRTPTSWALNANPNPLGADWSIAVGAAWLTFLGGLALRNRPMPRFLVWSGLVSYSVYLLHPLVIQGVWYAAGRDPGGLPPIVRFGWGVVLVTVVLTAAAVAYRYVELPAQRLGRRLIRRHASPGRGAPRAARFGAGPATAPERPGGVMTAIPFLPKVRPTHPQSPAERIADDTGVHARRTARDAAPAPPVRRRRDGAGDPRPGARVRGRRRRRVRRAGRADGQRHRRVLRRFRRPPERGRAQADRAVHAALRAGGQAGPEPGRPAERDAGQQPGRVPPVHQGRLPARLVARDPRPADRLAVHAAGAGRRRRRAGVRARAGAARDRAGAPPRPAAGPADHRAAARPG